MSKIFDVQNTSGTLVLNLPPGSTNGRFSAHRDTDLRLYGEGVVYWGEGVDENFYRLLENFASLPKPIGTDIPEYMQEAGVYNPSVHGIAPKTWQDYQREYQSDPINNAHLKNYRNLGINNPVNGQIWFNDQNKLVYFYDASIRRWMAVGDLPTGLEPPESPKVGDLWFDLNVSSSCLSELGYQLRIWNGVEWSSVAERYVLQAGDTMCGTLTMSNNAHIVLPTPVGGFTDQSHVVNLGYIETNYYDNSEADSRFVNVDGDTMTDFLTLHAHPVLEMHAATKGYVGSNFYTKLESDDRFVNITGDTMTGFLTLHADPTAPMHAVTKSYVDTNFYTKTESDDRYVNITGDTMTGFLTLHAQPVQPMHAATKQYVDACCNNVYSKTESDGRYVNITGDTMTGPLILSGDPTSNLGAATKRYVDGTILYHGQWTVAVTGGGTYSFDFSGWRNSYISQFGITPSGFTVIPFVQITQLRVGNPAPAIDYGALSFGDYAGVDYVTSSPAYTSDVTFSLTLQSYGVASSTYGGGTRSYSTRGVCAFRVIFIGGPKDNLFKYTRLGSTT